MHIRTCLLDAGNPRMALGRSIAERVAAQGKQHLWDERPAGAAVDTVVVHSIHAAALAPDDPFSEEAIIAILCDYGVSSHYLIGRRGGVVRLVPEQARAWHAGGSIMPLPDERRGVNAFSIGIELAGGEGKGAFTAAQYQRLADLITAIAGRAGRRLTVLGHEHVAGGRAAQLGLRAEPKVDPGPGFDWPRLARLAGPVASVHRPAG